MNHTDRMDLLDKIAQQITDSVPLEALQMHFYYDQYEYLRELSDEELLDKAEGVFSERQTI
jgi:hypothetical protein